MNASLHTFRFPVWLLGWVLAGLPPVGSAFAAEGEVSYYKDVRPIFEANCHGCHQPAKAKGDYVMTDFAAMVAGVEHPAVVPGNPEGSYLMELIVPGENGEAAMPQKRSPLHPAEVRLVREWIAGGAENDTPPDAGIKFTVDNPPVYGALPAVASVDWSPDGKWIAATGFHEVLLHPVHEEGKVERLIGLSSRLESVAFSPDGKWLAAAGGNPGKRGEIQIWNVEDRSLKLSHAVTFDSVYGVSWSPDGKNLSFGCGDHGDCSVRVLEVESGKEILSNGAHGDWALGTAWSVDGSHLISVGRDMAAKLTEVASQRFIDNITSITPGALRGGLHSVSRHPSRDEALLGGADGFPQIYRLQRLTTRVIGDDANLIRRYPVMPGRLFGVAWRPDGKSMAAVSSHGTGGMLRTMAAEYDSALPADIKAIVEKVADSQSPGEKQKLHDYVTADTRILTEIKFPGDRLYTVKFSPDGNLLVAAGSAGMLRIIDPAKGQEIRTVPVALVDPAVLSRPRPSPPAALPPVATAPENAEPPLDPALVVALEIEPPGVKLAGPSDSCQILATARLRDGSTIDATRAVRADWSGAVGRMDAAGLIKPAAGGSGILKLSLGGASVDVPVVVGELSGERRPDYIRDVMPVISRLGCNTGTCHGSKDGRNGFKLSLRGYDPEFDVLALTDEQAARRGNPAVPDDSLFLQKASAAVPHEGGQLTVPGEESYEILRAWIAGGGQLEMNTPRVTGITVQPRNPVVQQIGARQQMRVVATYADGTLRDVTALAFVESGNPDVAVAVPGGLVSTLRRGEAPVLARFEGAYAATTVTVMGDRTGFVWKEPEVWSEIDRLVAEKWQRLKIEPSGLCSDGEFLRRVTLDLTGLPPSPDEVTAFLGDLRETRIKRDEVIDRLIGSPAFVDHWANKWASLLQVNGKFLAREGATGFRDWIRQEIAGNTPWNRMVHSILTASGSNRENPPAAYYKILRTPEDAMENTTHLFLATRFNCNKCHDHPFERWTQDQYYQTAAWFSQVSLNPDPASNGRTVGGSAVEGAKPLYEITGDSGTGEMLHDRTKQVAAPAFPYPASYEEKPGMTRREHLAAWMTADDNRYFAVSFVNRIWGYLLGTGIIEPLDDIRAGNPPANPLLLEHLRKQFIGGGFDMRRLIRSICTSRTYQLSISTNQWNADDVQNFSHASARRLPAEALYDSIMTVTGSTPRIPGVPPGTRAAALPDSALDLPSGFLANLGRPVRESACECERSNDVQLGPVMSLLGGPVVADSIADNNNAIAALVREEPDDRELAGKLFLRVLGRPAQAEEVDAALGLKAQQEADHATLIAELSAAETAWTPDRIRGEVARETRLLEATEKLKSYQPEAEAKQQAANAAREEAIKAAEAAITERDLQLREGLDTWEHPAVQPGKAVWEAVKIVESKASGGMILTVQDDHSLMASGPAADGDYQIVVEPVTGRISGLILEVMHDARLPSAGPGLAPNGNFVLSEIQGSWSALADPARHGSLEFGTASASYAQPGYGPEAAIDGQVEPGKGWAVGGAPRIRQNAAFGLKAPLVEAQGVRLNLTLKFVHGGRHLPGRFRIWATSSADPVVPGAPQEVVLAVGTVPPSRSAGQKDLLLAEARALDPESGNRLLGLVTARAPVAPDARLVELTAAAGREAEPIAVPPGIVRLRQDISESIRQMTDRRLTAAQDLVWALINSPEFLFNH